MKKGDIFEGKVIRTEFPNKGIIDIEGQKVIVKNALEGQVVRFSLSLIHIFLLDKILKVYYNRRHNACPHRTDIIYMNFSERRRRKEVTFIDAFQRVTGWWEVMC